MSSWGCLTEEEQERYTLAYERIMQIPAEAIVQDPGRGFFRMKPGSCCGWRI